eukprot:jgi/Mesvir1/24562/Mv21896-RA.1
MRRPLRTSRRGLSGAISRLLPRSLTGLLACIAFTSFASLGISLYFMSELSTDGNDSRLSLGPEPSSRPSTVFCSRVDDSPPLVCAHGGVSSQAPPNTMSAFRLAISTPHVDCVEVDVSMTADGYLVSVHDRDLQRMSGRVGVRAMDMTLAQIKEISAGVGYSNFEWERIPLVEDAVQMLIPSMKSIIIDVKTHQGEDEDRLVTAVVGVVHRTMCVTCIVWAKSDTFVEAVKQLSPSIRTGYVLINETAEFLRLGMDNPYRLSRPEVISMHYAMVDAHNVELSRREGKEVYAWTADTVPIMESFLDAGVDALVTSYPVELIQYINKRRLKCPAYS